MADLRAMKGQTVVDTGFCLTSLKCFLNQVILRAAFFASLVLAMMTTFAIIWTTLRKYTIITVSLRVAMMLRIIVGQNLNVFHSSLFSH